MRKLSFLIAACVLCLGVASGVGAGEYPNKEIRMIVPFAAGGGTDAVARSIAKLAEAELGKPIVIFNKTGGAGAVGMAEGARSRADGYTITMVTRELSWLYQMNLAPVKPDNFEPICLINEDPAVLLVGKNSPYKTAKDLIEAARLRPGSLKFGSTAKPNFYLLALEVDQDLSFNQIPYGGAAEVIPAILGGHVDMTMMNPGEAWAQIKAGELIPLAVCSDNRFAGLPDVPTMKEFGYNVSTGTWRGIAVPPKTPTDVKEKLIAAFDKAVNSEEFQNFMEDRRLGVRYIPGDGFMNFMKEDSENLQGIVEAIKKQQELEKAEK